MHKFVSTEITELNIESHSDVVVKHSRSIGFTQVEISGSPKNIALVDVEEVNGVIYIKDNSSLGSGDGITITSGNSIMNFNGGSISNLSMSNGIIYIGGNGSGKIKINGKTVNLDDYKNDDEEDSIPTVITIYTPSVDLNLNLIKSAKFTSEVAFINSFVDICHRSLVDKLITRNLEIGSSNSSLIHAELLGGELFINASNSSQIITTGTYSSIRVSASNSSDVNTKGHCLGSYRANASNSSYIHNEAKVDGKKTQNISNSARIRL